MLCGQRESALGEEVGLLRRIPVIANAACRSVTPMHITQCRRLLARPVDGERTAPPERQSFVYADPDLAVPAEAHDFMVDVCGALTEVDGAEPQLLEHDHALTPPRIAVSLPSIDEGTPRRVGHPDALPTPRHRTTTAETVTRSEDGSVLPQVGLGCREGGHSAAAQFDQRIRRIEAMVAQRLSYGSTVLRGARARSASQQLYLATRESPGGDTLALTQKDLCKILGLASTGSERKSPNPRKKQGR